jgi:glucosamine kinase
VDVRTSCLTRLSGLGCGAARTVRTNIRLRWRAVTVGGWGAFAVDGGGSNTVVRIRHSDGRVRTWRTPSCAIATVGEERSFAQIRQILARVCELLEGEDTLRGCVASSSFPVAGEARPPDTLVRAIAGSGCAGRVALVNDVVPLLWAREMGGRGVVVNSGTGSVVLGHAGEGPLLKLGGHEHILSDQGSAYALAREGLRAATRAADGLGPATDLLPRAEAFYRLPVRELGRRLAEQPRPRHEIARFAPEVVALDVAGDRVAAGVVSDEATALGHAAVAAVHRLGLGEEPAVGFAIWWTRLCRPRGFGPGSACWTASMRRSPSRTALWTRRAT